ncbi:hypothetical protein DTO006G1_8516 [Penicillium roqueforti]|uniref:uncharacterized protein n=1 Tax=Penicillium roqueforti TaxID=5082 RepID=UPI00190BFE03|nr:uncharacterized protein LCP9604111_42 [Penicillium roqueforti]KAF9252516.1 hypothetical protein LCP9604111_42 [Penicillium roqueforti]KAI1835587.1 hypothetical protein CBS147337_3610 [Penicillium roqueforti]KAI2675561.1 hypothetical protein CBS147355_6555 [Penicillium roqueforti]KAI2687176.1 hypothetical protein LCP963914a_3777 [Penicillium roqueforti]KAI2724471.1 hypothetical protein CBS147318_1402 [Penicillium roqueforti]
MNKHNLIYALARHFSSFWDRSEFWNALMNDVSAEIVVLPLSLSGISPSNANGNREWFCGTIYTESRWHAGEPPKKSP